MRPAWKFLGLVMLSWLCCQYMGCNDGPVPIPPVPSEEDIVEHYAYSLKYNEDCEQADWVAYQISATQINNPVCERTDNFREDPLVKTGSAALADYKGSGYDRGHLCPAGDMKWDSTAMSESFYMSNISPQNPGFNRGVWKRVESQVREWALEYDEIRIVTGPVLNEQEYERIGDNQVAVPLNFYKVVLDYKEPELKGIGFVLKNDSSSLPVDMFAVSIDSVEVLTGIDFFSDLQDSIEEEIESNLNIDLWSFD